DAIGERPSVAVCFISADHAAAAEEIASTVTTLLAPRSFVGCTAGGVVGGERGVELAPAFALWAARVAGEARTVHLSVEGDAGAPTMSGLPDDTEAGTLLLLAEPFSFPAGDAINILQAQAPGLTLIGGIASAGGGPGRNRLVVDGAICDEGAAGILFDA